MAARRRRRQPGLRLRLYVAGNAPNSLRAVANATAMCATHFASAYELEVVDLLEHPARGLVDGIIVTPTLIRLAPLPVRRIIGNLSDADAVRLAMVDK